MRRSGILLPISSLPSKHGIGTLGKEAYEFVDFLKKAGQKVWQILPICPTSFGDSPYQSFSTFAGNPYFIDLDILFNDGLLEKDDYLDIDWQSKPDSINYAVMYQERYKVLKKAYKRFNSEDKEYTIFKNNSQWLEDYALFMAIKESCNGASLDCWPKELRLKEKEALNSFIVDHYDDIEFYKFLQYEFFKQWSNLKEYANDNDVEILGDCPIYVALDSADVWSNPDLFQLDEDLKPKCVAGVPPDAFSSDGQLWGNPLYAWDRHKQDNYAWWISRLKALSNIYDIVRIDHFIGFESYYSIEYGKTNGKEGVREKGPGIDFFDVVKKEIPGLKIIAEDLGALTDEVKTLLKDCGFPGMRVLRFAFGDRDPNNLYLPHNLIKNSVCYIGTHDNEPIMAYKDMVSNDEYQYAKSYISCVDDDQFNIDMIKTLEATISDLCIIQAQDILGLGNQARMNHPSTMGNNWKWRLLDHQLTDEHAKLLYNLVKQNDRI